ncbi:MAG: diacylglycerol kinase family lipid kinase [Caldiserica bacterium]|jgi:YegS/Rv2252/BmrU family lipid kinase|nr:diacylglycerol kinase family lipid kinase [Caldisericota bacterium]MDH7561880.1 diacylglycerol kinase family lipid kinase [Caldisericota bacterium]
MKTLIIVNPAAKKGKSLSLLPEVETRLKQLKFDYKIEISQSPEDPPKIARQGLESGYQLIVAGGGDGTCRLVAKALIGTEGVLGIIPMGRGNDYGMGLGISHNPLEACEILKNGVPREVDVGRTQDGEYFLNVAGAGFDAEVNSLATRLRWLKGGFVYTISVFITLMRFKARFFKLEFDGRSWEGRAMMVGVANAPYYGGGMKLCPSAILDDGQFTVCLVKEIGKLEFIKTFPKVFKGTHITHPAVEIFNASKIKISGEPGLESIADGDFLSPLPLDLETVPRALKVMTPKRASTGS